VSADLKKSVEKHGSIRGAARALGIPESTLRFRLKSEADETLPPEYRSAELETEVKALRSQLAAVKRETLDEQFVKQRIFKLAQVDPAIPKWMISSRSPKSSPGVPTLLASDWHFGEVVDPHQVGGLNEYNLQIARKRVRRLIDTTIDLLSNHLVNGNYPGIVFALGGDMISGDLHEELTATNEIEVMPTVIELFGTLCWCIDRLVDEYGRVFVPCASGNHGRNTHKTRHKGRNFTNFDWLVYCLLAKRFENDPRITFQIPDGPDTVYSIYGHRYLLTHGDKLGNGGDGIIGALGPIIRGDHRRRGRQSQIGQPYDTLLCGHYHQLIQLERVIVNGSLKGYCEYAYTNSYGFERPRQALWITHETQGITFSMPVNVDEAGKPRSSAWVALAA
jgi:hypothetical protein